VKHAEKSIFSFQKQVEDEVVTADALKVHEKVDT
jgi:hypothetical protein